MANPPEKTRSSALRPIAPPLLSQHLREFASRPDAWAVLARNMIPVGGHLRLRLVRCARDVQLLVRWTDRPRRNRYRAHSARAARNTAEIGWRSEKSLGRRAYVDFPRWHCRSAILDRADPAARFVAG